MRFESLRLGMKVHHPAHGAGVVKVIAESYVEADFPSGRRAVQADDRELQPGEPMVGITEIDVPLAEFIRQTTSSVLRRLGIEELDQAVEGLGQRWNGGTLVLRPVDPALQAKEVPLEAFFHKIVMMRNNLRVLEQKINSAENLNDGEKVEYQQYITRCYGSMTTFNVLFRNKEDQF
jgi:hypothetical protein